MRVGTNERLAAFERAVHRLAPTLLSETLLEPPLFTRLQVKAVLLDVLADAFALDLPTKTTKGLFKRLILSNGDEDQGALQYAPAQAGPKNVTSASSTFIDRRKLKRSNRIRWSLIDGSKCGTNVEHIV